MATRKVTITMPENVLRQARAEVAAGRATNLSAYVSEVLAERAQHDRIEGVVNAILAETGGEATASERAWGRAVREG